jgi:hypothetical protein
MTTRASSSVSLSALFLMVLGVVLGSSVTACRDKGKESADAAKANVEAMAALADKDVAEIERGLPEGAKKMAERLAQIGDSPKSSPQEVRAALLKMRQQVPDLGVAKSTFFAFTDEKGIAVRNDLEQDTMAGKDIVAGYPELAKALHGAPYVQTNGQFGTPNPIGPDREWVAAVPVKRADGTLDGLLVTGWTYRRFAYHLQETLKRDLQEQMMRSGDTGKLPVLYVMLFDKSAVYGARQTPPVNEKALKDVDLVSKTAGGVAEGPITITDRAFGWAAVRVPKLGPDVGIVVLRSEI